MNFSEKTFAFDHTKHRVSKSGMIGGAVSIELPHAAGDGLPPVVALLVRTEEEEEEEENHRNAAEENHDGDCCRGVCRRCRCSDAAAAEEEDIAVAVVASVWQESVGVQLALVETTTT